MPAFLLPLAAAAAGTAAPAAAGAASALTPSLIAGGAGLLGSVINAGSQLGTNSSQLSYSREMYDKQRADALADWKMQNEYNSPSAQMTRFKEAGLNPNLIYGQMSNSPVVRSSTAQSYNPTAPQIDLSSAANMAINQYYDTKLKSAQIDNLKEQNILLQQDSLIKMYEGISKNLQNQKSEFEVKNQKDLFTNTLEAMKANIRQTSTQTKLTDAQIENAQQQLKNLIIDGDIKGFEKLIKQFESQNLDLNQILKTIGGIGSLIPGIGSLIKSFR